MSAFATMFQDGAGATSIDLHGEEIGFDDGAGLLRTLRANVDRSVPAGFTEAGTPVYEMRVIVIGESRTIEEDGRGGLSPSEIVPQRSTITVALRPGGTPVRRTIRNFAALAAGMIALEVQ